MRNWDVPLEELCIVRAANDLYVEQQKGKRTERTAGE